jgi:hypothetical protein
LRTDRDFARRRRLRKGRWTACLCLRDALRRSPRSRVAGRVNRDNRSCAERDEVLLRVDRLLPSDLAIQNTRRAQLVVSWHPVGSRMDSRESTERPGTRQDGCGAIDDQ